MQIFQREIVLDHYPQGCHSITQLVVDQLTELPSIGFVQLFLRHTSAAILINEDYDPAVMRDFFNYLRHIVPEGMPFLTHTIEGPDDMPAHIKMALTSNQLLIPIRQHRLALGHWQGIWFCEFRRRPRRRTILATVLGI